MNLLKVLPILSVILVSACTQQPSGEGDGLISSSIAISSPAGGQTFNSGDVMKIQYDSVNVDHYQICFTTNPDFACDSAGWVLVKNHPYYPKSFDYTVPPRDTTTARIRVEGHS